MKLEDFNTSLPANNLYIEQIALGFGIEISNPYISCLILLHKDNMASRVLAFRGFGFHWRQGPLLFSRGTPLPLSSYHFQSTKTALLRLRSISQDCKDENLEDVLRLLSSKSTAWNHPGPAQFDFRSRLTLTASSHTIFFWHFLFFNNILHSSA